MECDFDPIPFKPLDPTITISVKPMLFAGDQFYPNGGWEDFRGFFDDIEEAKKALGKNDYFDWAHIVIEGKIVIKALFDTDDFPNQWEWEETNNSKEE